jgi:hypothetical protein
VATDSEFPAALGTRLRAICRGAALLLFAAGCGDFDERSSVSSPGPRHVAVPARLPAIDDDAEPRHLIIVIGDGMQLAHEVATSRYLFGRDDGLSFHQLPTRLFKTTWDVNVYNARASQLGVAPYSPNTFDPMVGYDVNLGGEAPYPLLPDTPERRAYFLDPLIYPDSASTATAMSTGIKTDSSNIAWFTGDPVNGALATTPQTLRRRYGMSIGFVTTVPLSHATPSGWFAHNPERFAYGALGHEILTQTRPEVVIGGGVQAGTSYLDTADVEAASGDAGTLFVERKKGRHRRCREPAFGCREGESYRAAAVRRLRRARRQFRIAGPDGRAGRSVRGARLYREPALCRRRSGGARGAVGQPARVLPARRTRRHRLVESRQRFPADDRLRLGSSRGRAGDPRLRRSSRRRDRLVEYHDRRDGRSRQQLPPPGG